MGLKWAKRLKAQNQQNSLPPPALPNLISRVGYFFVIQLVYLSKFTIHTNNFLRSVASQSKACSFGVDLHCPSQSLLCTISHATEKKQNKLISQGMCYLPMLYPLCQRTFGQECDDSVVSCNMLALFSGIKICLLLLNHHQVLRLFCVLQLNPLVIIVTRRVAAVEVEGLPVC